ncbi:TPA: hypothetical protein LVL72_004899 [Klebsiella oxytoca]|nr:hypothetical protein [Klebsiella oxytoca]
MCKNKELIKGGNFGFADNTLSRAARIGILAGLVIIYFLSCSSGYAELLNGNIFEFANNSTSSSVTLPVNSSLTITNSQAGSMGSVRCFSAYDGTLIFEGKLNQTVTSSKTKQLYKGNTITCQGEVEPAGIGPIHWAVMYNGQEVIGFNTNVTHADCSADVQNIELGVMPPGTTRTFSLPVTTTGGMLLLTSKDMTDGVIKMEGKDDVTIHPQNGISLNPAGGWIGVNSNSTINVVTSETASGVYLSSATVTLRCN